MILEGKLGTNPFKMGIVGGADNHSGYSANEEFNFYGSHGGTDYTPKKRLNPGMSPAGVPNAVVSSAGATGVWAEENTRAAIFDAMKNKEVYGTSGTLIRLRFFGGWGYPADLVQAADFVEQTYIGGVPMGRDLPGTPAAAKAPTLQERAWSSPILVQARGRQGGREVAERIDSTSMSPPLGLPGGR